MGQQASIYEHRSRLGHNLLESDLTSNLTHGLIQTLKWEERSLSDEKFLLEHDELSQKFVRVYRVLQKLNAKAVDCLKLRVKLDLLSQQHATLATETVKVDLEQRFKALYRLLTEAVGGFDNAFNASAYLIKEYELTLALLQLKQDNQISLDHDALVQEMEKHEKECFTIGFVYLDKNFCGGLQADDIPELSTALFNKINKSRSGKITSDEIKAFIESSTTSMKNYQKEINDIESEIAVLPHVSSENVKDDVQADIMRKRLVVEAKKQMQKEVQEGMQELKWLLQKSYLDNLLRLLASHDEPVNVEHGNAHALVQIIQKANVEVKLQKQLYGSPQLALKTTQADSGDSKEIDDRTKTFGKVLKESNNRG